MKGSIGGTLRLAVAALSLLWLSGAVAESARIAIVIDDLGYLAVNDREVLTLDPRIAVAIIPDGPLAPALSRKAARQQRDVLIHLPLSGLDHDNCEFEATCVDPDWSPLRMAGHLRWAAQRVEQASGINNHQGSRVTADGEAVRRLVTGISLLGRLHEIDLFVLDSRTTAKSRFERKASEAGLLTARRHVFLDHDPSPQAIEMAWEQLLDRARRRGYAIAIGHPYPETIEFLGRAVPELATDDVELVPLRQLLKSPIRRGTGDARRPLIQP